MIDPGAVAFDASGAELNVLAVSSVDTSYAGSYSVTYYATSTNGLLVSSKTRAVVVGLSGTNPNACLTQTYANFASTWPALLDLLIIKLGNIDEGQIRRALGIMISVTNAERVYLISQKQKVVIVDIEDILTKMDDLYEYADRAEEKSIRDVLQLERNRSDLKEALKNLTAVYSCPVPPPTYALTPIDTTPTAGSGGGTCTPPSGPDPHPNFQAEVAQGKINTGMSFSTTSPECPDRFSIVQEAVKLIPGAGYYIKNYGNNCNGYAVDIIAFSDGYIYDVLNGGAPDGNGPVWNPATCTPPDPSRYHMP